MARREAEGVLVFLFRKDIVHGTELLDGGIVQPCAFLHFGSNEQTLALDLSHLRLHIAAASEGQCVGRDIAAVQAKDTGHGVPEGRLAVATTAICDDEGFDLNLANGGETTDHLYIVDEFPVAAENGVQAVEPYLFAPITGRNGSGLGDEVLRGMLPCARHTETQVIGRIRGAEQVGVSIQVLRSDLKHRTGLFQCGGDVFGSTASYDIRLICFCREEGFIGFKLLLTHHALGLGFAVVVEDILCAASLEGGKSR